MKHILTLLLAVSLSIIASAQTRIIMGLVHDEDGEPVSGVTISADGVQTTVVSGQNGRFEIALPYSCRVLKSSHESYLDASAEIESSFVVITVKKDPNSVSAGQSGTKTYSGIVKDEEGEPISGAKVTIEGTAISTVTGSNGRFSIEGPSNAELISASGNFLIPRAVPIDGESFITIVLSPDTYAIQNQDRINAQKQKAAADSLKAAEAAQQKALKAQQKERDRFVADSLKAVKLAEEARAIATQDSIRTILKAEELRNKVIADSIKTARRDSLRLIRKKAIARNDSLYRNHGFLVSVELSYNTQPTASGEVIYENYGYMTYDDMVPVELNLLMGARLGNAFALSAGTGLLYEMVNLAAIGDSFSSDAYGMVSNYTNIDIPVFLNLKWFMSRSKVQPLLSLSGGLYLLSDTTFYNGGLGLNIRVSHGSNLYILGTAGVTPWPHFTDQSPLVYDSPITAGVKLGLAF